MKQISKEFNLKPLLMKIPDSLIKAPEINGSNISILILSLNRAESTINLLKSIQKFESEFQGEILILDQNSNNLEIEKLQKFISLYPLDISILKNSENIGVARGRNLLANEAKNEWLLFLDNDLIVTKSFISDTFKCFLKSNSNIINFSLTDEKQNYISNFGHFSYIQDNDSVLISVNPLNLIQTDDFFVETELIFGGALLISKKSFNNLGQYDENYFVGFEDIDLSLVAGFHGYKIVSILTKCFVHAEKFITSEPDKLYAEERFSRKYIEESAKYFEEKWELVIWSDSTEEWLKKSREKLGLSFKQIECPNPSKIVHSKQKMAIVVDVKDWAFDRIGKQWQSLLDDYEIDIVYWNEIQKFIELLPDRNLSKLDLLLLALKDYAIVHFMWVGTLHNESDDFFNKYRYKISTAVYDHYSIENPEIVKVLQKLKGRFYVSSNRLKDLVEAKTDISPYVIPDGVATDLFKFNSRKAKSPNLEKISIGWVGNKNFGGDASKDLKRFNSLFMPAIEILKKNGYQIVLNIADRSSSRMNFSDMPAFYKQIDLLVCTSLAEGTPNPVLEAVSSGVPVVSTKVGIVDEIMEEFGSKYLLEPSATPEELANKISSLIQNTNDYESYVAECERIRVSLDWTKRKSLIHNFITSLVPISEKTTKFCLLPFTTPSIETDGSIRLCSSSSIFTYREETNMGRLDENTGLLDIWTGEKYQEVRSGLLGLKNLEPYCNKCDYRSDGPVWILQYHLALQEFWRGNKSSSIETILSNFQSRHEQYAKYVSLHNTSPFPKAFAALTSENTDLHGNHEELVKGNNLAVNVDFNSLNRCNVGCIMCPPSIRIEDKGVPRDKLFVLTLDLFEKYTKGIKLNSSHFVGAYAEPLMNKELPDLIRAAKAKGSFTAITTNATLLDEKKARSILEAGLDMISVSIHGGTKEVAERVMRKSNFDIVKSNLLHFKKLRQEFNPKLLTYFNYVGMTTNIEDFGNLVDFCHAVGFKNINLFALIDGDLDVDKSLSLADKPEILRKNVIPHLEKARKLDINISISSPYSEIIYNA